MLFRSKQATGIEIQHVPYKGTGPNVVDLVAGRTQASSAGTPPLMPHVKSGKLRVVAVGTPKRLHSLPDVGTVAEQGYPGFEMTQWYGMLAPAAMAQPAVDRLAAACGKALREPTALEHLAKDAAIAVGSTSAEFAAFIAAEQQRWKPVIARARIKPD